MNQHPIPDVDRFILEHEETDGPFDALGRAAGVETFDLDYLHRNGKTHGCITLRVVDRKFIGWPKERQPSS
jgi:hypothetical protein